MKRDASGRRRRVSLTISVMLIAGLTACSGGSRDLAPPLGGAPAPATAAVPVKVIGGPLRNALVCLHANDDGECAIGEPQARTDVNGAATLDVPNGLVGQHSAVAMVGVDAVDADVGPVGAPFVLISPKDRAEVVSPLTTLVDAHMRATGADSAAAEALLRQRSGSQASLFGDYTAAPPSDTAAAAARTAARLILLTMQRQTAALASVVGTADLSETRITRADVRRATASAVLDVLPAQGSVLTDPAVSGPWGRDAALQAFAESVAANETGLTAAIAASGIGPHGMYAQAPSVKEDSGPAAALRTLRFASPAHWFHRALVQSPAGVVPNARALLRCYEPRRAPVSGAGQAWRYGSAYARRGDLSGNATARIDCPYGTRSTNAARDAAGRLSDVHCGGFSAGTAQQTQMSSDGRTVESAVLQIRALPGSDGGVALALWGPASVVSLRGVTFPTGSCLGFQRNAETRAAIAYDPTEASRTVTSADIAAGGDATISGPAGDAPCCAIAWSTPLYSYTSVAAYLEQVIAHNRGTPCRFPPVTGSAGNGSGTRNEWWGNSTIGMGSTVPATDGRRPGANTHDTQSRNLRFASTSTEQPTFYTCVIRTGGASGRNGDVAGTGTCRIDTLGDARVPTLSSAPASTAPLFASAVAACPEANPPGKQRDSPSQAASAAGAV